MAFVTERPLFFALHTHGLFEGNIAPSNTVRSWKIWPFIFTPYISPKPLFLPKIVTQSPIFFTLSRILEIFHSKTPNLLEFEKKVPKCSLFLWLLSLKDPYFLPCIHMVCLRGMLLPHTQSEAGKFDPLFSPPTSAPNPCFYQKLSPKVLFFSHCPEFWKFFTQRPLIGRNLRKRYPNVPNFYGFCHSETPPIFCLAYTWFVWGECCSLTHGQKLENFVFSKQNGAIWWILSGANLIEVTKIKFQFYRLNRPNCALWMNFIGGQAQGWYTG